MTKLSKTCLLSIVLLIGFMTQNALGYALTNTGYYQRTSPITPSNLSSTYSTALINAASAWNSAQSDCSCSVTVMGNNKAYAYRFGTSSYAVYNSVTQSDLYPLHRTTYFVINVNSNLCDFLNAAQKKAVFCHELGHAFGVGDIYNSTVAIMNANYCPSTCTSLQTDDIAGARASW